MVQEAYGKLMLDYANMQQKTIEQEEVCSNTKIEIENQMACKEKADLSLQTLEKERSDLLKERELFNQQIEALNTKL